MIAGFPELLLSLMVQATVLLLVTSRLTARQTDCRATDRLWSRCHWCILMLCAVGVLLPHLRLLPGEIWPAQMVTNAPVNASSMALSIFIVWAAGAGLLTMAVALAFVQAARLVSSSSVPVGELAELAAVAERLAMVDGQPVRILISPRLQSPFCWQFHRPVVVLPDVIREFPGDEVRAILRHELAHLHTGHPISLFLQRLVEIVFWFHPLVWSASQRCAAARELVCDRAASSDRAEAACLLKGLYRLAELQVGRLPRLPAGLAFSAHGSVLRQRVAQLLRISAAPPVGRNVDADDTAVNSAVPDLRAKTMTGNQRMAGNEIQVARQAARFLTSSQTLRADDSMPDSQAARGTDMFRREEGRNALRCLSLAAVCAALIWLPVDPMASPRSCLSPWPLPSAVALKEFGIAVRDYEVDAYSLQERMSDTALRGLGVERHTARSR